VAASLTSPTTVAAQLWTRRCSTGAVLLAIAAGPIALQRRAGTDAPVARQIPANNARWRAATFPIGFSNAPPPDGVTPRGNDAFGELATNGAVFHRCTVKGGTWGPEAEATLDDLLARSAAAGIRCAIFVPDLAAVAADDEAKITELQRVVTKYRSHPGLGYWKGADEPAWGRVPVDRVQRFHDIVQELDPEHPVWITQAPRGTLDSLAPYDPAYEIGAIDIYPVSYPPGLHSDRPNKNLSVVGEYADLIAAAGDRTKPFWMVLQICWSGVIGTGRTLRMPTFPEERYMTYVSIVHGARGLAYFGGNLVGCQNDRDAALGWNWTFYDNVLKPVLTELNPSGPLFPALIAPDSDLPVTMVGADDVEFLVRDTSDYFYVLAVKREGATVRVTFNDLPDSIAGRGDVLFEEPRRVSVSAGSFTDWFGPNEVHVYRFAHQR
jgi:hypothetical protein